MSVEVRVCKPLGRIVREIADKMTGEPPDAITLGNVIFLFTRPEGAEYARLQRHEAAHTDQQAAFAPRWARWLPKRARAWLGAPAFIVAYYNEYARVGYSDSRYEVEARAAE